MPHGTDRPYPIRILAFFEMIRPYHVGIRILGNLEGKNCKACHHVLQNEKIFIDTTTFSPAKFPDKYDRSVFSSVIDWSKYVFPSYLIGDGGFLLCPMAIAAVQDLDDTSLHTWQQELGLRRSEITIDGKNFDNETCHDPHINRNQITVRKVSCMYVCMYVFYLAESIKVTYHY